MKAALVAGVGSLVAAGVVFVVAVLLSRSGGNVPLNDAELSWLAAYSRFARAGTTNCSAIPHGSTDRVERLESLARAACRRSRFLGGLQT